MEDKMKESNIKKYILMLAIGFILIVLDVHVYTNLNYPNEYINSNQVIGEFQYYNLASTYGARCNYKMINSESKKVSGASSQTAKGDSNNSVSSGQTIKVIDKVYFKNIRIDIFNDFIGFVFIMIACFKLRVASKKFQLSGLCALCGFILNGILAILPFIFNGLFLCNLVFVLGLTYLACNLLTVFLFVNGLLSMCQDVCCRDERKWCRICWFISFVLQILTTFVFWLGSDFKMLFNLGLFCEAFLVFDIVLFWIILRRTFDYMQRSYSAAIADRTKVYKK